MWFPEFDHPSTEEWFDLTAWWKCSQICHACTLTKWNFIRVPNPLKNVPRRDYDNFMRHATQPGEKSSWAEIGVSLEFSTWKPSLASIIWTLDRLLHLRCTYQVELLWPDANKVLFNAFPQPWCLDLGGSWCTHCLEGGPAALGWEWPGSGGMLLWCMGGFQELDEAKKNPANWLHIACCIQWIWNKHHTQLSITNAVGCQPWAQAQPAQIQTEQFCGPKWVCRTSRQSVECPLT